MATQIRVEDTIQIIHDQDTATFQLPPGAKPTCISVIQLPSGTEIPFTEDGQTVTFAAEAHKYQVCVEIIGQPAAYGTLDLRTK